MFGLNIKWNPLYKRQEQLFMGEVVTVDVYTGYDIDENGSKLVI